MNKVNGTSKVVQIASTNGLATCPTCESPITREQHDRILRISEARQRQLAEERSAVEREREEVARERKDIAKAAVETERAKWDAEKARADREVERLAKQAEAEREKLARAHERELQAEVRKREVQEKQLARELATVQAKARAEAEARVRDAERAAKEQQSAAVDGLREQLRTSEQRRRRDEDTLKKTIVQLQEKAEAKDAAHFGPEGEEELVEALREQFPGDTVEHRGKGGDVLHTVVDAGRDVGKIVFECKRTKTWQAGYLRQTKEAMAKHETRHGVLVSRSLPARCSGMCVVGGVIVTLPAIATQIVAVLRAGMITIARLRLSEQGKESKTAALFDYLRGEEFSTSLARVQTKVAELREALGREKSHHDGWWRTRELEYTAILREASGIDARVNDLLGGTGSAELHAKVLARVPGARRAAGG